MPSFKTTSLATLAILYQAASVNGYAFGLGIVLNQAIRDTGDGIHIDNAKSVQAFSDTKGKCGNAGITWESAYVVSTDITTPKEYQNNACGDPCVTYDSKGKSQDELADADNGTPAGTLTVAKDGMVYECEVQQSTDCGGIGPVGANYVQMIVVCGPEIGIVQPPGVQTLTEVPASEVPGPTVPVAATSTTLSTATTKAANAKATTKSATTKAVSPTKAATTTTTKASN